MERRFFIRNINIVYFDVESPYGKALRRARPASYKPQSSSSFHEKDEELAEKIRIYRESMRRKARKPFNDEEFTFRRGNLFDFDAWYRAHFHDDFDTKFRNERMKKFAEQYQEQMEQMSQGKFRVRPPRPYVNRKEPSDIEDMIRIMAEREINMKIMNVVQLGIICIIAFSTILYILEYHEQRNVGPYKDPYAKGNMESSTKAEEK